MEKAEFYRDARRDLPGPLAGVRVVEVTTTWAGPMCGCMLADYGADVIKVEHPDGEIARRSPPFLPGCEPPLSFMHATVNRNKRSLALDLHDPRGREIFLRLAARSDVVIENFRPGTLDAWGCGYAAVRAVRPDVVYVSISGFGQWGPQAGELGYDPLAQAASGFLSLNGAPDGEPVKAPTFLADDLAGLHAAFAVLAALRHRDRTGEGQHVDVALLDAMLFQSTGYLTLGALGVALPRLGNQFRIAAPANTYRCRDGLILAGVLLDSHWKRLAAPDRTARARRRPALRDRASSDPPRATRSTPGSPRGPRRAPPTKRSPRSSPRASRRRVCSYAEAARSPHVAAREMLQPASAAGREHSRRRTGREALAHAAPVRSAAPALGAHDDEILAELGVAAEERRALREAGVVGAARGEPVGARREPD